MLLICVGNVAIEVDAFLFVSQVLGRCGYRLDVPGKKVD